MKLFWVNQDGGQISKLASQNSRDAVSCLLNLLDFNRFSKKRQKAVAQHDEKRTPTTKNKKKRVKRN